MKFSIKIVYKQSYKFYTKIDCKSAVYIHGNSVKLEVNVFTVAPNKEDTQAWPAQPCVRCNAWSMKVNKPAI
jgi:hypothetical protein